MKLKEMCQKLWGGDFSEKPYSGCVHVCYNGIGGQISIGLIFTAPFLPEEDATEVQVNWVELNPAMDSKSVHFDENLFPETMRKSFPIKDGAIDDAALVLCIREVERQLSRNKWMLRRVGV
jgi:hypothetical protein